MWLQRAPVVVAQIACSRMLLVHNRRLRLPFRSMTSSRRSKPQTETKDQRKTESHPPRDAATKLLSWKARTVTKNALPQKAFERTEELQQISAVRRHTKKVHRSKQDAYQRSQSTVKEKNHTIQPHNPNTESKSNKFPDWYKFTGESRVFPQFSNSEQLRQKQKRIQIQMQQKLKKANAVARSKDVQATWKMCHKLRFYTVQELLKIFVDPIQRENIRKLRLEEKFLVEMLNVFRLSYLAGLWDESVFGTFRDQLEYIEDTSRSRNRDPPENLLSQLLLCRVHMGDFDKAHHHLREIVKNNPEKIRRRSYCPLIIKQCEASVGSDNATALIRNSMDLFEEMVCKRQREIDHESACSIINACTHDDSSFPIVLDVLRVYHARQLVFPANVFEAVKKCFESDTAERRGWVVTKAAIDNDRSCNCCQRTLLSSKLSRESQNRISTAVTTLIKKTFDVFNIKHSHQVNFHVHPTSADMYINRLEQFLEKHPTKKVIIDGCNIGFATPYTTKPLRAPPTLTQNKFVTHNVGGTMGIWDVRTFLGVLEYYNAQGTPPLAIIREHYVRHLSNDSRGSPNQQALRNRYKALLNAGSVYTVKDTFPDDLFVLYAAVLSNSTISSRCKIITNDFFRDHFNELNALNVGRDVLQFRRNSQTHVQLWLKKRPERGLGVIEHSCYKTFLQIAQEQPGAWHIPAQNGEWLCLTHPNHEPQDGKYPQVGFLTPSILTQASH
eukprot:m.91227 g.91227  ORF g.91227 m.91227 type:complete len:726 (-) comp26452_c2_seq1:96-2273(-)